jgi:DNA polymerase-3 subunit beta
MELYIDREELGRGLARVQSIIERRSTQPMLANVLLHARDGSLRVTATDSEVAYLGELAANVKAEGHVAVDAAQLFQVIRALPEATVRLKLGEALRLEVESGRASFRLPGTAAEDFPVLPPFKAAATATLAERDLRRLVDQVQFSVATEDVRWGLNGAHLEEVQVGEESRLRMVATDGHRLACAEAPFTGSCRFASRMLVPRKALSVMRRLLEGEAPEVQLDFGDGALQLRRPSESFWFRLLDGEFPDYKAVVPSDPRFIATLRRHDLTSALKRVMIVITDRSRPARFSFTEEEVELRVQNVDKGDVRETVPVELDGGPFVVGFNARYLSEALNALGGDRVVLSLANPLAPCLVRDPDRDDAWFVVMPMRLD